MTLFTWLVISFFTSFIRSDFLNVVWFFFSFYWSFPLPFCVSVFFCALFSHYTSHPSSSPPPLPEAFFEMRRRTILECFSYYTHLDNLDCCMAHLLLYHRLNRDNNHIPQAFRHRCLQIRPLIFHFFSHLLLRIRNLKPHSLLLFIAIM